jgi:hypothetical protein
MSVSSPTDQQTLQDFAASCVHDPLAFVLGAYPWGQEDTLLAGESGPDEWQVQILEDIRRHLTSGATGALRIGVVSGHGVGKSALTSWLVEWFLATRPHPQIVVTANTGQQLETKTWREMAKWHKLSCFESWFEWTATKYAYGPEKETWFAAAVTWNKDKAEAFAGTHEQHVLLLFDEASLIDDVIWETAEGALTTPDAMQFCFGNGTRNTGRFKECFPGGRFAHRWQTYHVDSRTAKKADQAQIAQWIADYGEDSDFVRVRVKGQFPRAASTQFITEEMVQCAKARQSPTDVMAPITIGVDVARFGDDASVIAIRQGSHLPELRQFRELRTTQLTGQAAHACGQYTMGHYAPTIFVDAVGLGAGVVDGLVALGHTPIEVLSGVPATDDKVYHDKRAEMWFLMRDWLDKRACLPAVLPHLAELEAEWTNIQYGYDERGRLQLERKKDMKARGLASPDHADAVAFTFAEPVAMPVLHSQGFRRAQAVGVGFDPLVR